MRSPILAAALLLAGISPALADAPTVPAVVQPSLQQQVEAILAKAPQGTRWGLLVTTADGREVVAIDPDQRFIPASNTKLFTTAAALALIEPTAPNNVFHATAIGIVPQGKRPPDVVLVGGGGESFSTAPDCTRSCFRQLVEGVAGRLRKVDDVIADDSRFTDQRWSPGMSWNNIGTDSGTATSALAIDDNEAPLVVSPTTTGQPPVVSLSPYFTLVNEALTVADGATDIGIDWTVNGRTVRIYGKIKAGAEPFREKLGIDDPAQFAGWHLRRELEARGVKVQGKIIVVHRRPGQRPSLTGSNWKWDHVTYRPPVPLAEEVRLINKVSQNLHSEMLIRRLAMPSRDPIIFEPSNGTQTEKVPVDSLQLGLAAARKVFEKAGVPRTGYDFSDGSGMSTYNRVSPRAAIALLRWGATQPWGQQWRESFPIGGVDGTLRRRFAGTPLQGKVFAKTGTLNATNALSGYLIAASGKELTFSVFANDVPDGGTALPAMDEALLAIAAAN